MDRFSWEDDKDDAGSVSGLGVLLRHRTSNMRRARFGSAGRRNLFVFRREDKTGFAESQCCEAMVLVVMSLQALCLRTFAAEGQCA